MKSERQILSEGLREERVVEYTKGINEALSQAMSIDDNVILLGEGINDKVGLFGATTNLNRFGGNRVFDIPLAENGMMGVAVGAALCGLRPVFFHNRPDFILLAMDQLANHATKYKHMSGGLCKVPIVIWAAIGKGWGSAAQHSQSLQSVFAHFPGCKVVMPTTPFDSKGLLLNAIFDDDPVIVLEHRLLFDQKENVPQEMYKIDFGKAALRCAGNDYTVGADSFMVREAILAAKELDEMGITVDVIDLRSIKPWDKELIMSSVKKTGRLLVADTAWHTCNIAGEIISTICEEAFCYLKTAPIRIDYPDIPVPASVVLEDRFYSDRHTIVKAIVSNVS